MCVVCVCVCFQRKNIENFIVDVCFLPFTLLSVRLSGEYRKYIDRYIKTIQSSENCISIFILCPLKVKKQHIN